MATPTNPPTLQVENLSAGYRLGGTWLEAVHQVSFQVAPGQTYGLVGESGSGKTTLAMAIMGYLAENGRVLGGSIRLEGVDLVALPGPEIQKLWGAKIALVPQNPLSSLNPSLKIGEQIAETLRYQGRLDRPSARQRTLQLLRMVRLPDPEGLVELYPHQISGGMQQRVLIAMALSTYPRLLVLDEPTTSLDVTTQASILDLIKDLIEGLQMAVLYVTHNLGVVAQICDRVAVLYAGELVEDAAVHDLFRQPLHPYTRGLLDSLPLLGDTRQERSLHAIPGSIPALGMQPAGCVYAPRCPLAIEICRQRPPLYISGPQRLARCHRWEEIESGQVSAGLQGVEGPSPAVAGQPVGSPPTLDVRNVSVRYRLPRSLGSLLRAHPPRQVRAVEEVSLTIGNGATLGLVGESGSGKTTLARAVAGLVERSDGSMELLGAPLPSQLSRRSLETLHRIQMVFQNPEEALNPYHTIGSTLRRALQRMEKLPESRLQAEVARLLQAVGLPEEYAQRKPGQLSGGEKQRVAIARAFATSPDLLLADELASSLDVSVQAAIINLLNALQVEQGTAILFISHDLAVVSYLADQVAVIYLGQLMEVARSRDLFELPHHPYTEALLSAIPIPDPAIHPEGIRLPGDIPSPVNVPSGCPFHTRCPRFLGQICIYQTPPWRTDARTGKRYFCHIPLESLVEMQAEQPA